jgi:hypothetical protein
VHGLAIAVWDNYVERVHGDLNAQVRPFGSLSGPFAKPIAAITP